MGFMPVMLWTDALVYLLLAAAVAFAAYVRRHEHLLAPWRRVARSASGMTALTVLLFFLAVGLLDSLHYRPALPAAPGEARFYAVEVLSVFDRLAEPLGRVLN